MATGFLAITQESLKSPDGINELNRMLKNLFDLVGGDGHNVRVFNGYGDPNNVVVACIGSIYMRKDGAAETALYLKESGIGATGWEPVAGSAGGGGLFEEISSVVRQKSTLAGYNEDFVFGSPQLNDDGAPGHDVRFFFDKGKHAFRAGYCTGTDWDNANLGIDSFAYGKNTKASGQESFAGGEGSDAVAPNTIAIGYLCVAGGGGSGDYAFAIGNTCLASKLHAQASGDNCSASGIGAVARCNHSVASGMYSVAWGDYCSASGTGAWALGLRAKSPLRGQFSTGGNLFDTEGDAQYTRLHAMARTTDATPTTLNLFVEANRLSLPDNTSWTFLALIVAKQFWKAGLTSDGIIGTTGSYEIKGTIKRDNTHAMVTGDVAVYTAAAGDKLKITFDGPQVYDDIDMSGDASIDDAVATINAHSNLYIYGRAYKNADGFLVIRSNTKGGGSTVLVEDGSTGNGGECEDLFNGASVTNTGINDVTTLVGAIANATLAEDTEAAGWSVTAEADDANNALAIKVTGEVNKTIDWFASVHISQVG